MTSAAAKRKNAAMPPRYGRKRRHFFRSGIIERDRAGAARRKSKRRTLPQDGHRGESSKQAPRRAPMMPTTMSPISRNPDPRSTPVHQHPKFAANKPAHIKIRYPYGRTVPSEKDSDMP